MSGALQVSRRNSYRQASTRTGGPDAEAVLPRESVATTCQDTVPGLATGPSLANQAPDRWVMGTDWPPEKTEDVQGRMIYYWTIK